MGIILGYATKSRYATSVAIYRALHLLVPAWILAGLLPLWAGTYASAPRDSTYPKDILAHQPLGLTLTLSIPKNHFFQGEEIPCTLTFRNQSTTAYHLSKADWDRSRFVMDDIALYAQDSSDTPVIDPVGWYLQRAMQMDGGGGNITNLGEWSLTVAANQWLRFDHPGIYKLHAWSGRVQTGVFRDFSIDCDQVQLVSNQVTITIDPRTPEQERDVLDRARQIIHQPLKPSFMLDEAPDSIMAELKRLSYLQTPEARAELFPFMCGGNNDTGRTVALGLMAAPDSRAVAAELLASVQKGSLPLSGFLAEIYAALKTRDLPGAGPMSLNIVFPQGPFTRAVQDAKNEIIAAAEKTSGGTGPDFVSALWAAFQMTPQAPGARAALAQHQLEMSADQRKLLISSWQSEVWEDAQPHPPTMLSQNQYRQGGPDFFPVLLKAASAPDYDPYALQILCKLEPDVARPLVIADIQRDKSLYFDKPKIVFSSPVGLDALPDKPIPELTATFRQKLKGKDSDPAMVLPLIDRYGTADLLPDVLRFYRPNAGNWECAVEDACLRFWIRCEPRAGLAALQVSLHSRAETRCYAYLFNGVFKDRWTDDAQPVVESALPDPDPDVVVEAIKTLCEHGNTKAVEPVILALERIHRTEPPKIADEQPVEIQRQQQSCLAQSLLDNNRWSYTPDQKNRLSQIADSPK